MFVEGEIVINRPVEEVFDFVADERNEPQYNLRMTRAEKITPGPVGQGTRFAAEMTSMGRAAEMTIEYTGYDRPRQLTSLTHMSAIDFQGTLSFEPVPDGTRMRWHWEVQPHGLFKLIGPVVARMGRRQEQTIWTGLKRHLEKGPAASPPAT